MAPAETRTFPAVSWLLPTTILVLPELADASPVKIVKLPESCPSPDVIELAPVFIPVPELIATEPPVLPIELPAWTFMTPPTPALLPPEIITVPAAASFVVEVPGRMVTLPPILPSPPTAVTPPPVSGLTPLKIITFPPAPVPEIAEPPAILISPAFSEASPAPTRILPA